VGIHIHDKPANVKLFAAAPSETIFTVTVLKFVRNPQGRIQEFWKERPGKEAKPRTERRRGVWGPPPENFEKLDTISCNLAHIFRIRMASDIIQNWAFAEQITVAATISKPTDIK